MSVVLPPMSRGQGEAWSGFLDLSERHPTGWTLVGGQMVHLHCIERGVAPTRPTDDVDGGLVVGEADLGDFALDATAERYLAAAR